jgi:hypothetical protein
LHQPGPQPRRLPTELASRWQAAGLAGGMLVASAAQGVHSRRDCGKRAFEIPILKAILTEKRKRQTLKLNSCISNILRMHLQYLSGISPIVSENISLLERQQIKAFVTVVIIVPLIGIMQIYFIIKSHKIS